MFTNWIIYSTEEPYITPGTPSHNLLYFGQLNSMTIGDKIFTRQYFSMHNLLHQGLFQEYIIVKPDVTPYMFTWIQS